MAVPSRSTYFVWVPIAVIGLGLLAWAVLAGMPFGREPRQPERRPMDVVTEREATTGTVSQIGEPDEPDEPASRTVTTPPPSVARPVQPTPAASRPTEPAPTAGEVSEAEAQRALQQYVVSRRDYDLTAQCVAISGLGYKNAGYTFDVRNRCTGSSLGRWRVDSEDPSGVFRQHADGRFLKP